MKAIADIFAAVREAELLHPDFVATDNDALSILVEEVGEIAKALNEGDAAHMRQEIAQAGAVIIRWLDMTTPVVDCALTAQEMAAVSGARIRGGLGDDEQV